MMNKKKNPQEIIQFHKIVLARLLEIYRQMGLNTVDEVNSYNAKSKLEDSLWKIPEAYGKLNQRYISQGVKEVRDELDRLQIKRQKSSIWSSNDIKKALKWEDFLFANREASEFKVELEHVVEKQVLTPMLLQTVSDEEVFQIIDTFNIGCLVLSSEHTELPDRLFLPEDPWIRYREGNIRVWDCDEERYLW